MKTLTFTEFLTVSELARELKVHKHSIYRLVNQKAIPFLKIKGIGLRFDPYEIQRWIESKKRKPVDWDEKVRDLVN